MPAGILSFTFGARLADGRGPFMRSGDLGYIDRAAALEFELSVYRVVLIKTGTIPKTSSGKIQRGQVRARYLAGEPEVWGNGDGRAFEEADGELPHASAA